VSHSFALVIESLVAVLLLITIGYCTLLNRRLTMLKADEQSLRGTIAELITATEIAERAIQGLKLTVRECDQNLGAQLQTGTDLSTTLAKQIAQSEGIMTRLSQIALAAKPISSDASRATEAAAEASNAGSATAAAAKGTHAKALLAAAQAFSERRKAAGLAA
jgi:hypothetical protein